ncbi:MAG TPA: rhodanese-like domain-containing protein [Chitinophagales bacterium]|nr:rhodanese-like domain-containing protein [Chitinophagales bacterium]HRK27522.1 rhodanese-like domain-containing protein [Chitinophagales bacterium]
MKLKIEQFYDKQLSHASYAVLSNGEIALIDPGRNPRPYYDFAQAHNARIVAVIETHPHADFVSSHLEIAETTGATIYVSELVGATYPHETFDDSDIVTIGKSFLRAINTPGHSPDSICILLSNEDGVDVALFTGDTLFIGDVGRPDLRENAGNITATRTQLAQQMYRSTRERIMTLPQHITILPAHGAGSLCGKNLSDKLSSTLKEQLETNYALQNMTEEEFVNHLLADQPFIPKYFGYNVDVNKRGATQFEPAIAKVPHLHTHTVLPPDALIIDIRPQSDFKNAHLKGAINIQEEGKFETWLGAIVSPNERFYLVGATMQALETAVRRAAKIGYEPFIAGTMIYQPTANGTRAEQPDLTDFTQNPHNYTIIDIRNPNEYQANLLFQNSINLPLYELRERAAEIPQNKPIMVHCAGGYRSAAGSSIIASIVHDSQPVYDLSEAVKGFNAAHN